MPAAFPHKPATILVVTDEHVLTWRSNGDVTVTEGIEATEVRDPWGGYGYARTDFTADRVPVKMDFKSAGKSYQQSSDRVRLALAVLEGDSDAALLLADMVQEQYLSARQ